MYSQVNQRGAPGTIYLQADSAAAGDLIVASTYATPAPTPLTSIGSGLATSVTATGVANAQAQFASPDMLEGILLFLNGIKTATWPVTANDATSLTLNTDVGALTATSGDVYRGLYRLQNLKLTNANVTSDDAIELLGQLTNNSSTLVYNVSAPMFDAAKVQSIVLESVGRSVLGSAHQPITFSMSIRYMS